MSSRIIVDVDMVSTFQLEADSYDEARETLDRVLQTSGREYLLSHSRDLRVSVRSTSLDEGAAEYATMGGGIVKRNERVASLIASSLTREQAESVVSLLSPEQVEHLQKLIRLRLGISGT